MPHMQMGPASLPTPLSPTRGRPSGRCWRRSRARSLFRNALGVRCLAPRVRSCDLRSKVSSPALAPASGFRSCPAIASEAETSIAIAMRSRSTEAASLYRSASSLHRLAPLPLHDPARFLARPASLRHTHLQQADLRLAEASFMPSLDGRVDRCHRHPWDENRKNFKALRRSVPAGLCPEDKLKVRLNRPSDNIREAKFSTPGHLACGHEWINQRFVAFVTETWSSGNVIVPKVSR